MVEVMGWIVALVMMMAWSATAIVLFLHVKGEAERIYRQASMIAASMAPKGEAERPPQVMMDPRVPITGPVEWPMPQQGVTVPKRSEDPEAFFGHVISKGGAKDEDGHAWELV